MPDYDSPHWDWKYGSCVKHGVPEIPCPACLHPPQDPDLEISLSQAEILLLHLDPDLKASDLLPLDLHFTL